MALAPHTLKPHTHKKSPAKRVGRGNASGKGTYSARGLKGQKARSGGRGGLKVKGFRPSLLKIPKLRGFHSFKVKPAVVSLKTLARVTMAEAKVTPAFLLKRGVVASTKYGVKFIGAGPFPHAISVSRCFASKAAAAAIEKAGGKITF